MALVKKTVAELLALNLKDFIIEIEKDKVYVFKQSSDPEITDAAESVRNNLANGLTFISGVIRYADTPCVVNVIELQNGEETKEFAEIKPVTNFDTALLEKGAVFESRLPKSDMALTILSATGTDNTIKVDYSLEDISMEGLLSLYKKEGEELTELVSKNVSDSGDDSITTGDNIEAGVYDLLLKVQTAVDGIVIKATSVTVTN